MRPVILVVRQEPPVGNRSGATPAFDGTGARHYLATELKSFGQSGTMLLAEILDKTSPLSRGSKALLERHFRELSFPKGHILLRPNMVERTLYFIRKGSARAYSDQGDAETTFWFGIEGAPLLSMRSYVYGEPSYEYVELLERSELYAIDMNELKALFSADLELANWGRVFAERELVKTEERMISRQFKAAEDRYLELLQSDPQFVLRVPLRHIASYLGITPISLSRIRRRVAGLGSVGGSLE